MSLGSVLHIRTIGKTQRTQFNLIDHELADKSRSAPLYLSTLLVDVKVYYIYVLLNGLLILATHLKPEIIISN